MIGLAGRDYRALLDFTVELQAVERLEQFADVLLPAALRLVGADLAGWNDIDLMTGTMDGHLYPDPSAAAAFAGLSRLAEEPPLVAHFRRHPDAPAARISDICDRRAWHASPAYAEVYRHFGVEAQLGFPITTTPTRLGALAMNRGCGDFSARDREVLSATRLHVEVAHRRLLHVAAREAAIASLGHEAGWVRVDEVGTVIDIGRVATTLTAHCGVTVEPGRALPQIPQQLTVRRVGGGGGTVLYAIRTATEPAALGLTARQYDALCAVADGATVHLAARRLDVSDQTLATHLRDAYAALGVSGRLAALNLLRSHGLLDDAPMTAG